MTEFDPKEDVLAVLRSLSEKDFRSVSIQTKDWTGSHLEMLVCWALEAQSQRYQIFTVTDSQGLPDGVSGVVLHMLSLVEGCTPSLAARAIFLALSGE